MLGFDELLARGSALAYRMPTENNRVIHFRDRGDEVARHAHDTRALCDRRLIPLLRAFIAFKAARGSAAERTLYKGLTPSRLISRFLRRRPLAFLTAEDVYLLRNGERGTGGFESVGQEESPHLSLKEVMSYDEIGLSALLGVASPTHFINNGERTNEARRGEPGTFLDSGVYTGLVGARFERPGRMEWRHMVITPTQNVPQAGYGRDGDEAQIMLHAWARFYEVPFFPTYEEAKGTPSSRFIPLPGGLFLDALVYQARLRRVIEPFLYDANARAAKERRQAYVHAVGLGLGVWKISPHQRKLMLEVYAQIFRERTLPYIAHIDFSWFGDDARCGGAANGEELVGAGGPVRVHFSKRNPADPIPPSAGDCLLIAMYAWDGGAFPGNEYWMGSLSASGDPAAACCSHIAELQNPDINPQVSGDAAVTFLADSTQATLIGSV